MSLRTLILFVTSHCNAKCRTCFYWQELNRPGDLTFEEIDRLSATMPPFHELWLSGGEPMMRPRLGEIIRMFYNRNGIRTLNLPTNGLFGERTLELMNFITGELPELDVNLNFALDGFQATHDRLRGVPGNFEQAIKAIKILYPVRNRNSNIRLHVNSVITSENISELEELGWWLIKTMDLNGQYFQIIRGDAKDSSLKRVSRDELNQFYARIKPIHAYYARKLAAHKGGGFSGWFKQYYYTETIYFHYTVQSKNYDLATAWPMSCMAGQTILVIDYNGDIRACELRGNVANLREVGCDFSKLFPSQRFEREAEQIAHDGCWCTHVCFIHDSLKSSRRALLYQIPLGAKIV